MNSIKCLIAALTFGWAFGGLQAVTVGNITTTTHYPWNGKVDVAYEVSNLEFGSTYRLEAKICVGDKAYLGTNQLVEVGGSYSFTWDAKSVNFVGRVEDAKVVFNVKDPEYVVVDLSAGAQAANYPVTFRAEVKDPTNDVYKTTKLLLKRLGGKYVGVFEVTQKQYELVTGANPSHFAGYQDKSVVAKRPVERVSYEALTENGGFFDILTSRTKRKIPFALPTGDEWTAAARGAMPDGKDFNIGLNNYKVITGKAVDATWLPKMGRYIDLWNNGVKVKFGNNDAGPNSNATKGTAIVGTYNANDNGLYDMHGNVAEWTSEGEAGAHVLRGGSWQDSDADCAVGAKWTYADADASQLYKAGFRVFAAADDAAFSDMRTVLVTSDPFVVDVIAVRHVDVRDKDGNYTFDYVEDGDVKFVDRLMWDDKQTWAPTNAATYLLTNALNEAETATFVVNPLTIKYTVSNKTVVYDGNAYTITPDIEVPTAKYKVLYWCDDVPGQATEDKIEFTGVKYDDRLAVTNRVINFKIESSFYMTATDSRKLTIKPLAIANATATVTNGISLVYTGGVQTQQIESVWVDGIKYPLQEGRDYTVGGDTVATNVGDYVMVLTGVSNFVGVVSNKWTIAPLSLTNAVVTLSATSKTYNQQEQVVSVVSIKVGDKDYTDAASWTVTGTNATEVGEYWAVVTGSDNLTGSASNKWTIAAQSLTTDMITVPTDIVYFGAETNVATSADFSVADGGTPVGYEIEGGNIATNAGTYKVVVKANGKNYSGVATQEWTIAKFNFDLYEATPILTTNAFVYTGLPQTTDVARVNADHPVFGAIAFSNEAWVVSNNVATTVGEYWAVLYPTEGNLAGGPISNKWTIGTAPITPNDITLTPATLVYTGSKQTPGVTVKFGQRTLVEGEDYDLAWPTTDGYVNAGTKQVKVTMKGNFVGEHTKDFDINKAGIETLVLNDPSTFDYDGSGKSVTVKSVTTTNGVTVTDADYELTGNVGTNATTYTATVTANPGSQNFHGTASATWKIEKRDITKDVTVTQEHDSYVYDHTEHKPVVTVKCNGNTLAEGTDYTLERLGDCVNVGTVTNKITGIGSVFGTTNVTYQITQRDIGDGSITTTITSVSYDGNPKTNTIAVKDDLGSNLVENVDYALGGDSLTQTEAGPYTITVEGKGNYQGDKETTWEITKAGLDGATITLGTPKPVYDGTPKTQGVTVKIGDMTVPSSDYDVAGNVETNVKTDGDYTLTVTAKASSKNFKGSKTAPWNILPASISDVTITLTTNLVWNGEAEWAFTNTVPTRKITTEPEPQTMTFVVSNVTMDAALTTNVDYTVENASDTGTDAGAYTLTIKGMGNYTNTATKAWMIAPTMPMVRPNNIPHGTNEIYALKASDVDILTGRDLDAWVVHYRLTDGDGKSLFKEEWKDFASRAAGGRIWSLKDENRKRTIYEAYTYLKSDRSVKSDVIRVDYRLGTAADPLTVFADTNNVPCIDEFGRPWTNAVDGAVITNFFHNGQRIAMTRGNVVVSNMVGGVRQSFTNDAENVVYTDGALRYTLDGTLPTEASAEWTAGSEILISNTTTVIAKVFGKDCADSPFVTNVFVREYETYAPPLVTYQKVGETGWTTATTDRVEFQVAGLKAQVIDTNSVTVAGAVRQIWCVTNGCEKFAYPIEGFTFNGTVVLETFVADANGEYAVSPTNKVEFSMDDTLSAPVIAFSNATQVVAQSATTFTNGWQWVQITRAGNVFTKDTDGEIWFKTNAAPEFVKYVAPFKIWADTTVYAIATNSTLGLAASAVTNVVFTQQMAKIDAPVVTINPTITVKYFEVVISSMVDASDYVTYYTLDGSEPVGINGSGKTSASFKGRAFTNNVYVAAGSNLVVKAKTYREVNGNTDFIGRSDIATASKTRAVTIGDYLRPGAAEDHSLPPTPSTADLNAFSDATNGYLNVTNTVWCDDYGNVTNTAWVYDDVIAHTNGGKSMRSGAVRDSGKGIYDGTNSVLTATVYGPGTFTFYWKASVEFEPYGDYNTVWDFCELLVDGKPALDEFGEPIIIWGTNDWTKVAYTIEETDESTTNHVIQWNYVKDGGQYTAEELGTNIEDCVWVDDFDWSASPMMDQCDVVAGPLVYNKAEQFPTFCVTNRVTGAALTNGVDYVVEASKQTDVGNYTATLKGLGTTYTGSNVVAWAIDPLSLTNAVATLDATNLVYNGANQGVNVVKLVVPGADKTGADLDVTAVTSWTAIGTSGTAACAYTATVTGDGNLTDSVSVGWTIEKRDITKGLTVDLSFTETTYNREEQKPEVTVKCGETTFTENTDYTITWPVDCANVGAKVITVAGTGSVLGTTNLTYTIKKAVIESFDFKGASKIEYTGKEETVDAMNVKADNDLVLNKTEWKFETSGTTTYKATEVGDYTASVVAADTQNFEVKAGGVKKDWKIYPTDLAGKEVVVALAKDIEYTAQTDRTIEKGEVQGVTVKVGAQQVALVNYSFACTPQKAVGKHKAVVTTTDKNFKGAAEVEWKVVPRNITGATMTFVEEPILWTGSDVTVKMQTLAVGGCTFQADDTTFAYAGDTEDEAGTHTITVTGGQNFTGSATGSWKIKPTAPTIKPGEGGKYSKVCDYITVAIEGAVDDWAIEYMTNGVDWIDGPVKGVKFDIEKRTTVKARTVSKDKTIKSDITTMEYSFGENVEPTVALYGGDGAKIPTDAEVKGAGELVVLKSTTTPYTNFYYGSTKVVLTRFGTMTAEEAEKAKKETTYRGNCPYTDGEVWYTVDYAGTGIAPTNFSDGVSKLFNPDDKATWPTISSNATIVAQVFGNQLENTAPVTNAFHRIFEAAPDPTLTPDAEFTHTMEVEITKGTYSGFDPVLKDPENVKLFYTTDGTAPTTNSTPYTGKFEISAANTNAESVVVVQAIAAVLDADHLVSNVITGKYTYAPYKLNAPALDPATDKTYTEENITFTITRPDAPTCGHADFEVYYTFDGSDPKTSATKQTLSGTSESFTTNGTLTVRAVAVDPAKGHLDSDEVTAKYTRTLTAKPQMWLEDLEGKKLIEEGTADVPATNFWHIANLKLTGVGMSDVKSYYKIGDGAAVEFAAAGATIRVTNTFEVVAWAEVSGQSLTGPAVTNLYTRKWETLMQPMWRLQNPYNALTNKFWNTGDSLVITNSSGVKPNHYVAIWPTNVTFRYAVFTNSTVVVPDTKLLPFVRGETVARFGADTNALILVVEAEDYLPRTNRFENLSAIRRQLNPIGKPTIAFDNEGHRERVDVTLTMPEGANAMYYTYAITNDADGVATPWGSEYCVSNATDRYTNACFSVALKPHETLIVKARAYLEDNSSELVGLAETNFTARSEVAVSEPFSYEWSLADGLDVPDWKTFTSTSSQREGSTAEVVEDDEVKNFGDSSIHFKGVANSQWLSVETTVTGPGTVVFDWKTLCKKGQHGYNYDHMTFYVNGTPICKLDGDSGWQTVTNRINGAIGTKNVLKWVYEKDDFEQGGAGNDAWLDHFRWTAEETQLEITEDLDDWAQEYLYPDDYAALYNEDGSPNLAKWQEMLGWTSAQGRTYWECYVIGLDPEDYDSEFVITSPTFNEYTGSVSVTFNPRKKDRTYTLVGKKALTDVYWQDLVIMEADSDASEPTTVTSGAGVVGDGYKFFQLRVKMTQAK